MWYSVLYISGTAFGPFQNNSYLEHAILDIVSVFISTGIPQFCKRALTHERVPTTNLLAQFPVYKHCNLPKRPVLEYHVLGKGLSVSGYHVNHNNCIQAGSLDDLVTHRQGVYLLAWICYISCTQISDDTCVWCCVVKQKSAHGKNKHLTCLPKLELDTLSYLFTKEYFTMEQI